MTGLAISRRKWAAALAAVAIIAIAKFYLGVPSRPVSSAPARPDSPASLVARVITVDPLPVEAGNTPPSDLASTPEELVLIAKASVLATVNGKPLGWLDLMPGSVLAPPAEQSMSRSRFDMLLNRMVEREIAQLEASLTGVELSRIQRENLARMAARADSPANVSFDLVPDAALETQLAQRDMGGVMLMENLAAMAGVPSPHVNSEQVAHYYREHAGEFPPLPAEASERGQVWQGIDAEIRGRLAPIIRAEHDDQFRRYVEQLKVKHRVVIVPQSKPRP